MPFCVQPRKERANFGPSCAAQFVRARWRAGPPRAVVGHADGAQSLRQPSWAGSNSRHSGPTSERASECVPHNFCRADGAKTSRPNNMQRASIRPSLCTAAALSRCRRRPGLSLALRAFPHSLELTRPGSGGGRHEGPHSKGTVGTIRPAGGWVAAAARALGERRLLAGWLDGPARRRRRHHLGQCAQTFAQCRPNWHRERARHRKTNTTEPGRVHTAAAALPELASKRAELVFVCVCVSC